MSIRNKRLLCEISRYSLLVPPAEPWDEPMSVTAGRLQIEITHSYPFHPPTLFLNGRNALELLKKKYSAVLILVRPYKFDFPCVCCRVLISQSRWVPCMRLSDAIEDYNEWDTLLDAIQNYEAIKQQFPFDDLVHAHVLTYLIPKKT